MSVIVAKPICGSSTSRCRIDDISSRRSSSIRSVRCVIVIRRPTARRPSAGQDPGDRLGDETLDDVAFLEIVEPGQPDAALVVLGDLSDVVPEPPERLDPIGRDDLPVAPDTGTAADDTAVRDEAARDDRALADPEDLADLRATLD